MAVPEIRFKGFTDAWTQRKVVDIAPLQRGFDLSKSEMIGGDYPVVMSNGILYHHNEFKAKAPGVVTGRSGTIGKLHFVEVDYWPHNTALWVTDFMGNFPKFIYHLYDELDLSRFGTGTGVPTLNRNDVHNENIRIPCFAEQQKIATFMDVLDDLIAATQRKVAGLKQLKAAYLQQMFPQDGEKVPRVRFGGFSGDWEVRKADEIFLSISDKNHGSLPVLSASQERGMVLRDEIGIDIKFDKANTATYKRVLPGQFVIHLRSFQGGLAYAGIEGITSPAYTVLDFIDKDAQMPEFWVDILKSENFIKMLESVTYGIRDGRSISFNDFSMLKLSFPSQAEQVAIGNFFLNIDVQIKTQSEKMEKLKQIKAAYLQKMFA